MSSGEEATTHLKGARGVTDMISKPCQIKLEKDIISKSFSK